MYERIEQRAHDGILAGYRWHYHRNSTISLMGSAVIQLTVSIRDDTHCPRKAVRPRADILCLLASRRPHRKRGQLLAWRKARCRQGTEYGLA